ncbi:MAG: hypothetical protein K6E29_06625, partial [Cyanobacteria bacterium RUI128]|nr:hypothetical protein [Cyanobacteria bacterium RUI128]
MAKSKIQTIDVSTVTADMTIEKSKFNGIYFKGISDISTLLITSDHEKSDLTMTVNGHTVTFKNYFAKNGAFPIKTIKTDSTTYNLVDYVDEHNLYGVNQEIVGTSFVKNLPGTVFNDDIVLGGSTNVYAGGGNDTITPSDANSILSGGTGTNT